MERTCGRFLAYVLAAMAGALCLAPVLPASEISDGATPHAHFRAQDSCRNCHVIVQGRPDPGRFTVEVDRYCFGCHRKDSMGRIHPADVPPGTSSRARKIPPDFRLNEAGRIMCLTCHTAHGPYLARIMTYPGQSPEKSSPAEGAYFRTLFLRRTSPSKGFAALCDACHGKL